MNDRTKRDIEAAKARTTQDSDRASRGIQTGRVGDAREANPFFQEREQAAGIFLAGNDPLEGRRSSGGPFDGVPLPGSVDGPIDPRDSEDGQEIIEIKPTAGGGGFSIRQITGNIGVSGTEEPTTSDYQQALIDAYDNASLEPSFGDLITLRVAGGSRLVARFWVLNNDLAATNATVGFQYDVGDPSETVTFNALNFSYAPLEQIIGAIQDYLGGGNGGQDPDGRDVEPDSIGPFAISVNGKYDLSPEGFWVPGIGNPSISVNGGTIIPFLDENVSISAVSSNTNFAFPGGDGVSFVNVYVQVDITFTGTQGNRQLSGASGSLQLFSSTVEGSESGGRFVNATTYRHFTFVGSVGLARRGNRRYARITQARVGNIRGIDFGSNASGAGGTDANGVVLKDGLREVILCSNGKPYSAFGLFFNLTEIT